MVKVRRRKILWKWRIETEGYTNSGNNCCPNIITESRMDIINKKKRCHTNFSLLCHYRLKAFFSIFWNHEKTADSSQLSFTYLFPKIYCTKAVKKGKGESPVWYLCTEYCNVVIQRRYQIIDQRILRPFGND